MKDAARGEKNVLQLLKIIKKDDKKPLIKNLNSHARRGEKMK